MDAAAAVAYTLGAWTEPYFSGLGGGGFMTIYSAKDDKVSVLDFRETAPAAANAQMVG
ncbi:MAG: gamma-glutamyltransferase [Roseburia sp.]